MCISLKYDTIRYDTQPVVAAFTASPRSVWLHHMHHMTTIPVWLRPRPIFSFHCFVAVLYQALWPAHSLPPWLCSFSSCSSLGMCVFTPAISFLTDAAQAVASSIPDISPPRFHPTSAKTSTQPGLRFPLGQVKRSPVTVADLLRSAVKNQIRSGVLVLTARKRFPWLSACSLCRGSPPTMDALGFQLVNAVPWHLCNPFHGVVFSSHSRRRRRVCDYACKLPRQVRMIRLI